MSKTWYSQIDKEKCIECSACINKCRSDVYDKEQSPTPVVKNPDNCHDGCHGCGDICPTQAISYFGEKK